MHERTIPVEIGDDDGRCADLLLSTLTRHQGIGAVALDTEHRVLRIRYDPNLAPLSTVQRIADQAGVELGERYQRCVFSMDGVSCGDCGTVIERGLSHHRDVRWGSANPASGLLSVQYVGQPDGLAEISREVGGGVRVMEQPQPSPNARDDEASWWERNHLAVATAATFVFLVGGWLLGRREGVPAAIPLVAFILTYVAGGFYATRQALSSLLARHVDVDLLMVLAALGAAVIGHWIEGGILLFLFSLGNALEHYALGRTHRAIRALMALHPEDAVVVRDGREVRLPVEELVIGDVVIVKAGERIPVDARVLSGESAVDQSAITGESMPIGKGSGDGVFAGTINGHGLLRVRVERVAQESTLARIIRIVEEARGQKSRTQRFTDAFEGTYALGVIGASALTVLVPVLFFGQDFQPMFYRAMTLLVVASPCALVISTPASILSALTNGARQGILFKGAIHLENTGAVDVVVFDKTGTLTQGQPRVTDVIPAEGVNEQTLLAVAGAVERGSEHPLGLAVARYAAAQGIPLDNDESVTDLQAIPGRGVRATMRGQVVRIGNEALFAAEEVGLPDGLHAAADTLREAGKTTMFVTVDSQALGLIAVADVIRPAAPAVVAELKRLGIQKTIVLTGDNERAARAIARQVGVDEWRAGLLPEEKLNVIRDLEAAGHRVAMVGDGVNDAPALAVATVGIAMGAAGSDVALETADVVLMADDLTKLPYAIELSRRARRTIRQNLAFALGVIATLVPFALLGAVPLPLGVVGHEGSTIVVVSNGLRLLRFRSPGTVPAPTARSAVAD